MIDMAVVVVQVAQFGFLQQMSQVQEHFLPMVVLLQLVATWSVVVELEEELLYITPPQIL
jgi:hypothetical protein